eukprot:CAMPEP_0202456464 /NCGR_PEP_ID=MMETSP1360-20130828/13707_1 /ASSEMBLY_ACC=CAM_ASM_000848 /TAXON_ID=515479 /ORGANISM="Licmophora paradoxa, Strain CCMP2313" /LENGTH=336 /DNA_ID=CAMNT_0049076269 /DNA_START=29 /DNA_END=1039 /DNA_ORIENTATION=+
MTTSLLFFGRGVAASNPRFHRAAFVASCSSHRPHIQTKTTSSSSSLFSTIDSPPSDKTEQTTPSPPKSDDVPLYQAEGIFAVNKPLNWTSNNVVSYIRGILERDTRQRGGTTSKVGSRKKKSRIVRVGHGGTLDPLATGVLVVGVGKGTKQLQTYLKGSKKYRARGEFGFETNTLDMDGNVTKRAEFDHITIESIQEVLPSLTGTIQQIPPVFSAIKKGGKKMYEEARKGKTADDLEIEAREVTVYSLELVDASNDQLPNFDIDMECGGGTFVRSIIRDIGYKLDSVATTTILTRTKQGQFEMDDTIEKPEWTADTIYAAIERYNAIRETEEGEQT